MKKRIGSLLLILALCFTLLPTVTDGPFCRKTDGLFCRS